jgi:hypothetical protein
MKSLVKNDWVSFWGDGIEARIGSRLSAAVYRLSANRLPKPKDDTKDETHTQRLNLELK